MMVSKRYFLFQGIIFRFHAKLQGCNHHCPLIGPAIRALVLSNKKGGKKETWHFGGVQAPLDSSLMIVRNKEIHQLAGKNAKTTACSP